ncbi:MAG: DUF5623 domain-containing protein [Pseudomonadota bacterium]
MLNDNIRPSSIDGIKRLATQIKKANGTKHSTALDLAAKSGGFENFTHARRSIAKCTELLSGEHPLFLTRYWYESDPYRHGRETLEIRLSKPLLEICSKSELKMVRGLGGRLVAPDHIVSDVVAHSQEFARGEICKAVRALLFMEATGLKPSDDFTGAYPENDRSNKVPGSDHVTEWYDNRTGQQFHIDEPYFSAVDVEKRAAWAEQHCWHLQASKWPGIYYPYSCGFFVATDASTGYDFEALMAKIDTMPAPLTSKDWSGASAPNHDVFVSPMAKTPQDIRRAKCKGTIIAEPSRTTIPYGAFFGPQRRRPRGKMPLTEHVEAGKIIKAVLHSDAKPYSVNRRMDSVRCELENWMEIEIRHNEPDDFDFFDVYYHDPDEDGPFAKAAESSAGLIEILEELKSKLHGFYPDCAPLRTQTSKIDTAIKLTRKYIERHKLAA